MSFLEGLGGKPVPAAATGLANAPAEKCAAPALPNCLSKPLEPPDSHFLNAAQGWLGLGDHQSAMDELKRINPLLQSHIHVLAVRCEIYTVAKNWPAVAAVAWTLVKLIPHQPHGWIQRSFALHEMRRTQQAFELLLPAAEKFPNMPTVPYNLACYCAQLGNLVEARRWLHAAYAIGDASELRLAAQSDPDLAPLLPRTAGI